MKDVLEKKLKEAVYLIAKAEKSLKKAPEGTLVLSRSNGSAQYFHKTKNEQKKGEYISTKNRKLITALAQKDYDLRFIKVMKEQRNKLCQAIKLLSNINFLKVYNQLSETRKKLVNPYVLTDEQYIEQWENIQYEGKSIADDIPVITTERGEQVRSKTEKILADKFFSLGIPYRYEYPVTLKGYGKVYPDFILLSVKKRTEIYLEHFGMMDNPEYAHKAIQKLETYAQNGIYIGKNLLVTFETLRSPLDMKMVEGMLKEFIL